jgi:hypothetical protein
MQVDLVLVVLSGGAAVAGCSRSCLGIGWHQIGSAGVEQRTVDRLRACGRALRLAVLLLPLLASRLGSKLPCSDGSDGIIAWEGGTGD